MVLLWALLSVEPKIRQRSRQKTKHLGFRFEVVMPNLATKLFLDSVGPEGPIADALLAEILVNDSTHPVLVQRPLQRHAMSIARLERSEVPAHFARDFVLRGRSRLERVVVTNENFLGIDVASMDLQHLVLQNVSIVVKIVGGKLSGDLNESCRHFSPAERAQFAVCFRL